MPIKFRLICYTVVALLIPLLIWLVYHEVPMDAIKWIAFAVGIAVAYEIGLVIQKRIRKKK